MRSVGSDCGRLQFACGIENRFHALSVVALAMHKDFEVILEPGQPRSNIQLRNGPRRSYIRSLWQAQECSLNALLRFR